jgi:hypothetical protein
VWLWKKQNHKRNIHILCKRRLSVKFYDHRRDKEEQELEIMLRLRANIIQKRCLLFSILYWFWYFYFTYNSVVAKLTAQAQKKYFFLPLRLILISPKNILNISSDLAELRIWHLRQIYKNDRLWSEIRVSCELCGLDRIKIKTTFSAASSTKFKRYLSISFRGGKRKARKQTVPTKLLLILVYFVLE